MITLFSKSKNDDSKLNGSNNNFIPVLEFTFSIQSTSDEILPKANTPEETETKDFMASYVSTLFANSSSLTQEQKSIFGKHVQAEMGQTWFARVISAQRTRRKCVSESTFYSLVQHFAIVLFECANSDHFSPAKILMNMCFTFYHEVQVPGCEPFREYLSTYLRNQSIWKNLRFWNAAFFDALEAARNYKPVLTQKEVLGSDMEAIMDDKQYQENVAFGQLGTFVCNMHAFGLEKDLCEEFLEKQLVIASLPPGSIGYVEYAYAKQNKLQRRFYPLIFPQDDYSMLWDVLQTIKTKSVESSPNRLIPGQEKLLKDHLVYLYEQTDPYS